MEPSRLAPVMFSACALLAIASPAAADVRDVDSLGVPVGACLAAAPDVALPPDPGSGVNDGAFPHLCVAALPRAVAFQASTGEWILFRIGDSESTLAGCQSFESNVTVSFSLDGQAVGVDVLPCQFRPGPGDYFVDYRFLSHPLAPGAHTLIATFASTSGTDALTRTIAVLPEG